MNLDLQRLINQRITGMKFEQPEAAVRWMGALQAQDYAQAVWAVGLRTADGTLKCVEQALAAKKIVRTWPMRGTLHFVPAEDARWMLKLSVDRNLAANRRRAEELGLTGAIIAKSQALFYEALKDSECLSRPGMMRLLEQAGIPTDGQRGYHLLWNAAQAGLIAIGPMANKQQTFVLLDKWAPNARDLPREEALAVLAMCYFSSRGPATLNDFAWWAGQTLGNARSALAAVKSELINWTIAGKDYWMAGDADLQGSEKNFPSENVFLLPGFDEYLLGYADRSGVLSSEDFQKIIPGANGVFKPILVAGGQVAGTWRRFVVKNKVQINIGLFKPLAVPNDVLIQAAKGYADFLELPLSDVIITIDD